MAVTPGSPSANNELQANIHNMLPRSSSNDETRRGGDRPTLPPIRDLFSRELSQPLHQTAPGIPGQYSPSAHFSQLALPDEPSYRGEQSRSSLTSSHAHAQAGGRAQLRPLTTPHQPSQRARHAVYTTPTPAPHSLAPFQHESHDTPSRSEPTPGMAQYSYPPPPPPVPPHQNQSYTSSSASRAIPGGYQHARPMAASYSGSSTIVPSGLVTLEQSSSKYECTYCGKGFTRPSSLKIHVHSHTGERPFKCTFEGCNRTFSVQSNMRRHARTHLQTGNEARESEGEDESEEDSPQPRPSQGEEVASPR